MKYKIFIIFSGLVLILNIGVANIYWANLHSHTSLSDGQGMPDEAYLYARDTAHIDILAITDHTHYMNQGAYQYLRQVANQFTENGRFIGIAGQEFGNLSAFGHFSIFEADSLCPVSVYNLEETYKWIARKKVYGQYNHPRATDFSYFAYNRDGDNRTTMLEVVNGSGTYTPFYEDIYIDALNEGWHIAPVANQDNHRKRWGNATTAQGQIPLTGVICDALTKEKVLDAFGKKRIYACEIKPSTDKIYLRNFSIGDAFMGDVYYTSDNTVTINLNVDAENNFAKIYLYRNGILKDSMLTNQNQINWTYSDTITNGYYFIKGLQQDGDRFWTAPIWVSFKPGPTGIEAWPNPIRTSSLIKFPKISNIDSDEMLIYSMEGNLVYSEKRDYDYGNSNSFTWNGKNQNGKQLDNGVYYVVIKVITQTETKVFKGKVALLK